MVTWVDCGEVWWRGDGEKLDSGDIKKADRQIYPLLNGADNVYGEGARWELHEQGPDRVEWFECHCPWHREDRLQVPLVALSSHFPSFSLSFLICKL